MSTEKVVLSVSYALKEIVKRTLIRPMAAKCVLLHVADMVRESGAWEFWESHRTTAKHLGTDRKVIRRHLAQLEELGVLFCQTERMVKGGCVNVFMIDVSRLLSLPCVDDNETREKLVKRLIETENYWHELTWPDENGPPRPSCTSDEVGSDNPPRGSDNLHPRGLTTPPGGAHSPPNGNKPHLTLIIGTRANDHGDRYLSKEERAESDEAEQTFSQIEKRLNYSASQPWEAGRS